MEDNKVLNYEDLDAISGGRDKALIYYMTAEEQAHFAQLQQNYADAQTRYLTGEGSKAELNAALKKLMDYTAEMQKKYP